MGTARLLRHFPPCPQELRLPIRTTSKPAAKQAHQATHPFCGASPGPRPPRDHPALPTSYLLDVLLHADIRRVHQRTHDLHVAMDHEGFIGAVRVDANPAVVKNGVGELRPLPEHVAVALKLAGVGGLWRGRGVAAKPGTEPRQRCWAEELWGAERARVSGGAADPARRGTAQRQGPPATEGHPRGVPAPQKGSGKGKILGEAGAGSSREPGEVGGGFWGEQS